MFASTLLCSNIAIFGNVNLSNSRFYIFLPLDELSLDIVLGKKNIVRGFLNVSIIGRFGRTLSCNTTL